MADYSFSGHESYSCKSSWHKIEDLGDLDVTNIDWVIVGGESGSQARPMNND